MGYLSTGADRVIRELARKQHWVVSVEQVRAAGLTPSEVTIRRRAGAWTALHRGVYLVDSDLYLGGELPRATQVCAGLLAAGPRAVAYGPTAAELWGLPVFGDQRTVHVAVPGSAARHSVDGLRIHQVVVPAEHRAIADGLPTTSAVRTVADSVCSLPRYQAVALVDASLHQAKVAEEELAAVAAMIAGRRGCVAGRRHLAEADGRAQSPAETRVRLICADGGVAPDRLQCPIHDQFGTVLGYADLAWSPARLAAEVDGRGPHSLPAALFRDRHRQNDFIRLQWRVIRFTWADTFRAGYVLATVRAALGAGRS